MTLVLLIPIVILMLFVILFLSLSPLRKSSTEEREDLVKQVYQYSVAFITLIMIIGGGIFTFMNLSDYFAPNTYIETYDQYKSGQYYSGKFEEENTEREELSDEELRRNYNEMVEQRKEQDRQRALNGMIQSLGWIIIPLPVFIFFQRKIGKDRKESDE
ncbi:hypothetical protein GCM10011351_25090 [Paraliobacillus quinghaiensis]|uniref:Uncharacterized protein n=1 Tax=Paraliobacillus quinghaiensis TaxID=470815 RepID=A0A917TVT7_9BACI|nr:hypothetical protein [Paraliobacillus quinghaiensis]GGM37866.1 hypothetical protein GCM10011351_25090 [Paraliobacillus quinghaiensis]